MEKEQEHMLEENNINLANIPTNNHETNTSNTKHSLAEAPDSPIIGVPSETTQPDVLEETHKDPANISLESVTDQDHQDNEMDYTNKKCPILDNAAPKDSTTPQDSDVCPKKDSQSSKPFKKKHKPRLISDESDSDNEPNDDGSDVERTIKKHKRSAFSDSDSESEIMNIVTPHNKSFREAQNSIEKSRLAMLCDSDSDGEPNFKLNFDEAMLQETKKNPKPKKLTSKGQMNGDLEDKPKKMTTKEAAEQRKEIKSESQRMLRERNVSLPYHKPKSRSLKEFLARRPKLSRAAPVVGQAPPSVAIKMSNQQLAIISKQLQEREKEVKEFYKSDDSDNDEETIDEPTNNDGLTEEANSTKCDDENTKKSDVVISFEGSERPTSAVMNNSENNKDLMEVSLEQALETDKAEQPSEISAESYDFHLDEETTDEQLAVAQLPKENAPDFTYTDLDREIENFREDPQEVPIKSKLELLKQSLANDKPTLSGGPDEVIDLDSDVPKPTEVAHLMERFAKHVAAKKHHPKHRVKLNVVTVASGGDVHQEEVAMNVESDEESAQPEEKPGAKFQRLKEELQKQMEQKKTELWLLKAAKGIRGVVENEADVEYEKDGIDFDEDEEAEMTDDDDDEDIDVTDKPRQTCEFLDDQADVSSANEDEEDIENNSDTSGHHLGEQKKVLKRIVKPQDDSEEEYELFNHKSPQFDSTVTADEDEITSHQPRQLKTPIKPDASQPKSISDFLTPISFITSIQNLASTFKNDLYFKKGPSVSPFDSPNEVPQKKLFLETEESSTSLKASTGMEDIEESQVLELPNTQDLLGICSGEFTGVTQLECTESSQNELKSLGQEDMVISQLLDEEELENFKKKFESPESQADEILGGGIIDSDDDSNEAQQTKKRKNQKRIQFSDDSSDDEEEDDEKIDLQDDISNIDYDSEENEIDSDAKQEKLKLADFVEAEAELSESEWGSEDEDEKGLDQLEFELGDTEKFDEEKVKSDLEKIHMRRMLDDDTREVKLLQEILLEDGELHGAGRQRQFKWKNINEINDDQTEENKEDDVYLDEEESEEQWRKQRHQREMYLKQQRQKSLDAAEDLLCDSQLLKMGHKFLQRSFSLGNSQNGTAKDETTFENTPLNLQNMRGSFLNRTDEVLQRVAEYTKVTSEISEASKKTTKHFLFQSVSEHSEVSSEAKKRKAAEGTPNVVKKLRLTTNLSPAVKKKLDKPERSKKLFDF